MLAQRVLTNGLVAAIKYPELDAPGRAAVWRKFFELAGCRIGLDHEDSSKQAVITQEELDELALKPFNGTC
jgi:hypothetical protein